MVVWNVYAVDVGTPDEHLGVSSSGILPMGFVISISAPITYQEALDGSWQSRMSLRYESYTLPCECDTEGTCRWHTILEREWAEEDMDAIDSWRESRGDMAAMLRRTTRKIRLESEILGDV